MNCYKCGKEIDEFKTGKLPFRATCPFCHTWLHCCKNCKNYCPGKPNDCLVPGTEYIADREANNFCEDFSLLGQPPAVPPKDPKDAFKKLFGD